MSWSDVWEALELRGATSARVPFSGRAGRGGQTDVIRLYCLEDEELVEVERVTDRLEILKLPDVLYPQIASGQIPPAAVKPLAGLERIHSGLAACATARVYAPAAHAWEQPLTWTDLVGDPIGVLLSGSTATAPSCPTGCMTSPILCRSAGSR